jgi:hypothetical protein
MGGYSGEPYEKVSLLQGIRIKLATSSEVLFAQGCRITENLILVSSTGVTKTCIHSREVTLKLIDEAVIGCPAGDIIILALAETEFILRRSME